MGCKKNNTPRKYYHKSKKKNYSMHTSSMYVNLSHFPEPFSKNRLFPEEKKIHLSPNDSVSSQNILLSFEVSSENVLLFGGVSD